MTMWNVKDVVSQLCGAFHCFGFSGQRLYHFGLGSHEHCFQMQAVIF